jgi:hypothetical protein
MDMTTTRTVLDPFLVKRMLLRVELFPPIFERHGGERFTICEWRLRS